MLKRFFRFDIKPVQKKGFWAIYWVSVVIFGALLLNTFFYFLFTKGGHPDVWTQALHLALSIGVRGALRVAASLIIVVLLSPLFDAVRYAVAAVICGINFGIFPSRKWLGKRVEEEFFRSGYERIRQSMLALEQEERDELKKRDHFKTKPEMAGATNDLRELHRKVVQARRKDYIAHCAGRYLRFLEQ